MSTPVNNLQQKSPVQSQKRNTRGKGLIDTCERNRRSAGTPVIVEPVIVPAPIRAIEVQVQRVAAAIRVAQNSAKEVDMSHILGLEQLLQNAILLVELPVLPERQK